MDEDFFCISYIDDIKNWLQECKAECDESNPLRSIIEQSINEIDIICHQTAVDEKFQKEVEGVLNANGKTSIADKVGVLKKIEVERYAKYKPISKPKPVYSNPPQDTHSTTPSILNDKNSHHSRKKVEDDDFCCLIF